MRYKVTRFDYSDGVNPRKKMVLKIDAHQARVEHGVLVVLDTFHNVIRAIPPDQWDRFKRVEDAV